MTNPVLEQAEFAGSDYEIIPWYHGQEVLYYQRFGSYQGEWAMLARNPESGQWYIYKDWYGSCSGCDAWEGQMDTRGYGDERTPYRRSDDDVQKFVAGYKPFVEFDRDTATALAASRDLRSVMPRNEREWSSDGLPLDNLATEWELIILLTDAPELLTPGDAFRTENAETRRRIVEHFGTERVLAEAGATMVQEDGPNQLLAMGDKRFLHLQDASTPRRYLLRVPPDTKTVLDGIAWSFAVDPAKWRPLAET